MSRPPQQRFLIKSISRSDIADSLNQYWEAWITDEDNEHLWHLSPETTGQGDDMEVNMTPIDPDDERLTQPICQEYANKLHECEEYTENEANNQIQEHEHHILTQLGIIPTEPKTEEEPKETQTDAEFLRELASNLHRGAPNTHIERLRDIANRIDPRAEYIAVRLADNTLLQTTEANSQADPEWDGPCLWTYLQTALEANNEVGGLPDGAEYVKIGIVLLQAPLQ
jgi:hypothetical protein